MFLDTSRPMPSAASNCSAMGLNNIASNVVRNFMLKRSDGGAIYTLGMQVYTSY